jgi:DNA repair exonuclease SbcCD ATPase subunit
VEQQLEILWESGIHLEESAASAAVPQALEHRPAFQDSPALQDSMEEERMLNDAQEHLDQLNQTDSTESIESIDFVAALLNEQVHSVDTDSDQNNSSLTQRRITQLEQALYQCQLYIDELKKKLVDQEFLEEQLATTESFSHIQKQAIETLKSQVGDQKTLHSELENLKQQLHLVNSQYREAEVTAQLREAEFSSLKLQMLQSQADLDRVKDKNQQLKAQLESQQISMVQETQQRIIAQKTAERLRADLNKRDASVRSLESKLKQAETMLSQREDIIAALKNRNSPDSQKDQFIQGLSSTLLKAQRQITDLENDLSNQSILQVQLQHSTHELEQDSKLTQARSEQLEQQVNDLQEQVLRQAQQSSEYETAVQHWKTRCLEAEDWTSQVAKLWEGQNPQQLSDSASPDLTKTLSALSRWFKGSRGNLTPDDSKLMTPRELLGIRPHWQSH